MTEQTKQTTYSVAILALLAFFLFLYTTDLVDNIADNVDKTFVQGVAQGTLQGNILGQQEAVINLEASLKKQIDTGNINLFGTDFIPREDCPKPTSESQTQN